MGGAAEGQLSNSEYKLNAANPRGARHTGAPQAPAQLQHTPGSALVRRHFPLFFCCFYYIQNCPRNLSPATVRGFTLSRFTLALALSLSCQPRAPTSVVVQVPESLSPCHLGAQLGLGNSTLPRLATTPAKFRYQYPSKIKFASSSSKGVTSGVMSEQSVNPDSVADTSPSNA